VVIVHTTTFFVAFATDTFGPLLVNEKLSIELVVAERPQRSDEGASFSLRIADLFRKQLAAVVLFDNGVVSETFGFLSTVRIALVLRRNGPGGSFCRGANKPSKWCVSGRVEPTLEAMLRPVLFPGHVSQVPQRLQMQPFVRCRPGVQRFTAAGLCVSSEPVRGLDGGFGTACVN
jgi:hypothetical protein